MMTSVELIQIIQRLAHERPIFHSEADFQHALAWLIHEKYPSCRMRLEVNPYTDGQRAYIDVLCHINKIPIAIELKYKTRKLDISYGGEDFHLLDQSAQDTGRYDFIKDIGRLERFVSAHPQSCGFAIFLTNDANYWQPAKRQSITNFDQFRIHDNSILQGNLQWGELASEGTKKGREQALALANEYPLHWNDYSNVTDNSAGQFRYLLLAAHNEASNRVYDQTRARQHSP
jgi:hypothetical protein